MRTFANAIAYSTGNIVGFCVSVELGKLRFFLDGIFVGPVFPFNPTTKKYFPGVTLFKSGDSVSIDLCVKPMNFGDKADS
jgi:hypothetical protein